jgi:hypothetical protein
MRELEAVVPDDLRNNYLYEKDGYRLTGCLNNDLFSSIPTTKKIGVDPSSGGTFRSTSDEFFLDKYGRHR